MNEFYNSESRRARVRATRTVRLKPVSHCRVNENLLDSLISDCESPENGAEFTLHLHLVSHVSRFMQISPETPLIVVVDILEEGGGGERGL